MAENSAENTGVLELRMAEKSAEVTGLALSTEETSGFAVVKEEFVDAEDHEEESDEQSSVISDEPMLCPEQNLSPDSIQTVQENTVEEKIREVCPICEKIFEISSEWKAHQWEKHDRVAIWRNTIFNFPGLLMKSLSGCSLYDPPVIEIVELPCFGSRSERVIPKLSAVKAKKK